MTTLRRRHPRPYLIKLGAWREETGAATMIMTLILLLVSTLIILFAANVTILQNQAATNLSRSNQAFEAAQAGLEYGINYLNKKSATILANPSNGYLQPYSDIYTTNVMQANNSKFTVTYSNPIANNYQVIKITSTGTNDDGTATDTISQIVKFGSMLLNAPTIPLGSKGNIALANSSQIVNNYLNKTILSASNVTLSGWATTVIDSGVSSTPGNIASDITQNNAVINNISPTDLFSSYFGLSQTLFKNNVANYFSSNVDRNYNSVLQGLAGTSIWIEQTGGTANINGILTVGSTTSPVIMIINGNNNFSGFVVIYGFVYINGNNTTSAGASVLIVGGLATTGNISGPGSLQVFYSPTVLNTLQNQSGMQYYAKIPGSWKDF